MTLALANHGADADMRDPVPDLPKMAFSQMKALIHKKALGVWAREWTENRYTKHKHRQTKNWKPEPDGSAARILVQNNDRLSFRVTSKFREIRFQEQKVPGQK